MNVAEMGPIEAYVPHRGAMLLLDRLIEAGDEHAVAEAMVPDDGLFVRDGRMPAWVGVEYMAQAIAAWSGARPRPTGAAPRVGFLLGSRRFEAHCPDFAAGTLLRIEVRQEFVGDNGLGMFNGLILIDGAEVARARISIFEPADGSAYLTNGVSA